VIVITINTLVKENRSTVINKLTEITWVLTVSSLNILTIFPTPRLGRLNIAKTIYYTTSIIISNLIPSILNFSSCLNIRCIS